MCDDSVGEDVSFGTASRTLLQNILQNMLFPVIVIGAPRTFGPDWNHVIHALKSVSPPCFVLEESGIHPSAASLKSDSSRSHCAVLRRRGDRCSTTGLLNPRQRVPLASPEPFRFRPEDCARTVLAPFIDQIRLDRTPVFQ